MDRRRTRPGTVIVMHLGLWAALGRFGVCGPSILASSPPARPEPVRPDPGTEVSAPLWSEPRWRTLAARSIEAAPGCVALVLIDPAQPGSEAAIARCLLGLLRPSDPVGRYGTRQVAALIQVDLAAVGILVAERARARLAGAGLACLVGVSISLGEGLDELLIRATSDLMARRESAGISARW